MALNFPSSPTVGQTYSYANSIVWRWDGSGWQLQQNNVISYIAQSTDVGFQPYGQDGGMIDGNVVVQKDFQVEGTVRADFTVGTGRVLETIANNFSSVSGTVTLDLSQGDYFAYTLIGNTTFAFSNPPASGIVQTFMLICKQDAVGSRTITWPTTVKWSNGTDPVETPNPNASDVFSFVVTNGGTTYAGSWSMANTLAF